MEISTIHEQLATLTEKIQVAYASENYPRTEVLAKEFIAIVEDETYRSLQLKQHYAEECKNVFYTLSASIWRQGRAPEAMPFAQQACAIAEEGKAGFIWVAGRMNVGVVHAHLGQFQQAEENFVLVIDYELQQDEPDYILLFSAHLGMGNIHASQRNYAVSLEHYHKALDVAEKKLTDGEIAKALGGISILYKDMEMYETALKYALQVLEIEKKRNNPTDLARTQSNIGLLYHAIGESTLALEHLFAALKSNTSIDRQRGMSINFMNIGVVYLQVGQYEEALENMEKALLIDEKLQNKIGIAQELSGMGKIYSMPESPFYNKVKAEELLLRALALEKEHNNLEMNVEIRTLLADLYKDMEQWKEYAHFLTEIYEIEKKIQREEAKKLADKYAYERQIQVIEREKETLQQHTVAMEEKNNVISQQKQRLEKTLFELHEITAFKDLMMGTIVHDFKNPLHTILQAVDNKNNGSIEERRRVIEVAARRMLQLTMNILDIQHLETAALRVDTRPFESKAAINAAIDEVLPFAYEKSIRIVIEDSAIHATCNGDKHLVERILVNLLSNAIKYTSIGGSVAVSGHIHSAYTFCFTVRDTGKGISPDLQERIFARFTKGNDAHDTGYVKSTGLGLTFCKLAVEAHGGSIWLESEEGKGTSFFFTIPFVDIAEHQVGAQQATVFGAPQLQLTDAEHNILAPVIDVIHAQQIKIYEYSALMAVLDNAPLHSEALQQWRHNLEMAALEGEQEVFTKLLKK